MRQSLHKKRQQEKTALNVAVLKHTARAVHAHDRKTGVDVHEINIVDSFLLFHRHDIVLYPLFPNTLTSFSQRF